MDDRRTPLFALLAWLPLVAALVLAAARTRAVFAAFLLAGLGGLAAAPFADVVVTPVVARVRRVHGARAPDGR